jgi:CDP-glycerol glycerophosphotransferase (TagB/SpsB family)
VLIAPTWRPEFSGAIAAMNRPRPAASQFEDSPFLALYATLLTDERLLQCAREAGYALDFLLHPYVAANSPAFARRIAEATGGAGVEVRTLVPGGETPYEILLERSDLLVTDFSGIQYDFAYMGKPVVYFHPPALPPQYGHGAMDYETMGFGEIAADVDELVRVVCDYVRRDCAMTPEYERRIDDFFAYRDGDNCARILADLAPYAARYVSIPTR